MSGRSSCLRLPQAEIPATNRARGEQERDAPLADGEATQAAHGRVSDFWCLGLDGRADGADGAFVGAAAARSMAAVEDLHGPFDDGQLVGVEARQQVAQLAQVELAEALEERLRIGRRRDDDLAAIVGVVVPLEQARARRAGRPARWRTTSRSRAGRRARTCAARPAAITTYRTLACAIVMPTSVNSEAWLATSRCIIRS